MEGNVSIFERLSKGMKSALTIAGSDSGGGAGIQADLKTFEAHGVFGTSVITALTAQNTVRVSGVFPVPADFVIAQMDAVLSDFTIGAAKTGMLHNAEIISAISVRLSGTQIPLVVDPVMVASSGDRLLETDAETALREQLLPMAALITPNLAEGAILSGRTAIQTRQEMEEAARKMARTYGTSVLQKGGHLEGTQASDFLITAEGEELWLHAPFIATQNTHGTGCTLSAAITAQLALGKDVVSAVKIAKQYVHAAIRHSWAHLGHGKGTLKHAISPSEYEH